MPGQFGNKGGGRKGYGFEIRKKRLIEKSLDLTEQTLDEKKAFDIAKIEIGRNIDVTSKGESMVGLDIFEYVKWRNNNKSNGKDKADEQENTDLSGRNIGQ